MADLAPLRRTDPTGLTGGVGREVVVVHVALGRLRRQGVELLLHAQHVQRGDAQDLGLAALEQRRAVHARDHADLGGQGTDVGQPAAVDAHLVGEDLLPDELLGQRPVRPGDLLLAARELLGQLGDELGLEGLGRLLALLLVGDRHHLRQLGRRGCRRPRRTRRPGSPGRSGTPRSSSGTCAASSACASHRALMNGLAASRPAATTCFGRRGLAAADEVPGLLGGLGLDHHDRDVTVGEHAAGHDHVEGRLLELVDVGEADPLVADQGDADAADRAGERQARQLGGHRRGVDRDDVVGLVGVERHHGDDDLDLVAQALDEAGAQRPVDQPAGEDRALGRAALAAEERAGDAPGGVHPLLDVDGQGEEVDGVARLALRRRGRQQHGVLVEVDGRRAGGLTGQQARLEADDVACRGPRCR